MYACSPAFSLLWTFFFGYRSSSGRLKDSTATELVLSFQDLSPVAALLQNMDLLLCLVFMGRIGTEGLYWLAVMHFEGAIGSSSVTRMLSLVRATKGRSVNGYLSYRAFRQGELRPTQTWSQTHIYLGHLPSFESISHHHTSASYIPGSFHQHQISTPKPQAVSNNQPRFHASFRSSIRRHAQLSSQTD